MSRSNSACAIARVPLKDIDVVLQHTEADLAHTLERALTGDAYQGFTFRRKRDPLLLENRTVNMEFAVSYRGGAWTGIVVDIARAEPGESEIEWVRAIPLTDVFGSPAPSNSRVCRSVCTSPRSCTA